MIKITLEYLENMDFIDFLVIDLAGKYIFRPYLGSNKYQS